MVFASRTSMLLLLSLASASPEPLYVQASTLALRDTPNGQIEAWLRINTPVEVLDEDGDMVRVRLSARPAEHPVEGWVAGEYLGLETLHWSDAQKAAGTASRLGAVEQEQAWKERKNALHAWYDPADESPVELAICQYGRVELLGTWTGEDFVDTSAELDRARALDLSAHHWVRIEGSDWQLIEGSPFVTPFAAETWNEVEPSAYPPAPTGADDPIGEPKIVLGPCETEGAVFTSRPLRLPKAEEPNEHQVEELERYAELALGSRLENARPSAQHGRVDLVASNDRSVVFATLAPWGVPIASRVVTMKYDDNGRPIELPDPVWIEVGDYGALAIVPWTAGHTRGAHVWEFDRGGVEHQEILLAGGGC